MSFTGFSAADLREKITSYHHQLNHSSMDWVITSCSMTAWNGRLEALVVFNSKLLGDV